MPEETKKKMSEARLKNPIKQVGDKNYFWTGGRYKCVHGYIHVWKPDHLNCTKKGYVREHRLVMEEHLGRLLEKREIVHHINGIRDDNRIENLQLFNSRNEHDRFHMNIRNK